MLTTREQPDIILLDLDLSGEMALASIPDLLAAPQARILILTGVRIRARTVRPYASGLWASSSKTKPPRCSSRRSPRSRPARSGLNAP